MSDETDQRKVSESKRSRKCWKDSTAEICRLYTEEFVIRYGKISKDLQCHCLDTLSLKILKANSVEIRRTGRKPEGCAMGLTSIAFIAMYTKDMKSHR